MKQMTVGAHCALVVALAGMLTIGAANADKPSWAGAGKGDNGDKGGKSEQRERQDHNKGKGGPRESAATYRASERFGDRHRTVARDYYNEQYRGGHCPPGLAKKNNGCMPPGQARKWSVGRPLPREVIYYDVPPALVVQFGAPPSGHRYVRVAGDILLLAIGTGMVIDAIQNLGR